MFVLATQCVMQMFCLPLPPFLILEWGWSMILSSVVLTGHEISGDALTLPLQVSKAFLPLQGMTLIPHVNSRAPFDFAKISALPQDITNDIVCDTL